MKKLPRVVIVGFPNVGKSTLFNRILGRKKALVHTLPGMTRDVVTASATIDGHRLLLVDTGGLFGVSDEPLSAEVRKRAWREAEAASILLFVVDGKRDIAPAEEELFRSLKRLGKPVLLVVNKFDSPAQEEAMTAEYYRLGVKEPFFVSAEHKLNIGPLVEALAAALPPPEETQEGPEPLKIAVVGRINVGKSSLINKLAGDDRVIVSETPGTTRDSTDTMIVRAGKPYCLVDTAGVRKLAGADDSREKAGIIRSRATIKDADVVCLVLDAQDFPTHQDARIAQLAYDSGKPLVIALNKWDLVDRAAVSPEEVRRAIFRKLGFVSYAPILFVSALTGQRIVKILEAAEKVHAAASRRVETSRLNAFLEKIVQGHAPRLKSGGRVKMRYMTQADVRPPTFILFKSARTPLAPAYERYFTEALREEFGFQGTPLRLIVRSD